MPQKNDYEKKAEAVKTSIVDIVSTFVRETITYKEVVSDPVILAQIILWCVFLFRTMGGKSHIARSDHPGSEVKASIYTLLAVLPLLAVDEELAQAV